MMIKNNGKHQYVPTSFLTTISYNHEINPHMAGSFCIFPHDIFGSSDQTVTSPYKVNKLRNMKKMQLITIYRDFQSGASIYRK